MSRYKSGHNSGNGWSRRDIDDLRHAIAREYKIPEIAAFLLRSQEEVQAKALELGLKLPTN